MYKKWVALGNPPTPQFKIRVWLQPYSIVNPSSDVGTYYATPEDSL